jgi:hypothetical protein
MAFLLSGSVDFPNEAGRGEWGQLEQRNAVR